MGKKHKGKRGGGVGCKGPKAPPPTTLDNQPPSEDNNEIAVDEKPNAVPLPSDARQNANSIQVQAGREEKQGEGNISSPGECIALKLATATLLPEKPAECQDERAIEVVEAVPKSASEEEMKSSVVAPGMVVGQSSKVVEVQTPQQEVANAGPQTLSRRQKKKMNKVRGEQESQKTINTESPKVAIKTESKDNGEENEPTTIKCSEMDKEPSTAEVKMVEGLLKVEEETKISAPQEKLKEPLSQMLPVTTDQVLRPNMIQKQTSKSEKPHEKNSLPKPDLCKDEPEKPKATVQIMEVTKDHPPILDNTAKSTCKSVNEKSKNASAKQKPNENSKASNKKCPYEHEKPTQKSIIDDQVKPPQITGMIFETGNSEQEQKKDMIIKSASAVTKSQPKDLAVNANSIEQLTPVGPGKNIQNLESNGTAKSSSPSGLREVEIDLKKEPLEDFSALPPDTVEFIVESMTDSTTSDIAVVVEKSLENLSSVPDEEMMKLFKIVSKDFEKSPEPTTKEKFQKLNEPIARAGAALANLIDAVEQTESKIKEMVEETKNKQKSNNKSKKSKSKTPEKTKDLTVKQDSTDILSDAILVESPDPLESDLKSDKAKSKPTTDPKNVQRSDFVLSAEQQMDKAKSLLNNKTNAKARGNHAEDLQKQQPQNNQPKKTKKPVVPPRPESTKNKGSNQVEVKASAPASQTTADWDEDSEEEYIEYKFSSRKVFLHNICHVCQKTSTLLCPQCSMISYCSEQHCQEDSTAHKDFCAVIQEIAKKRGGHVTNNAKILDANDFRNLRVHTLNLCCTSLKRPLQPFEKEMLLFPRICLKSDCKNWKPAELMDCPKCNQVAFCKAHRDHLPEDHENWCRAFTLYQCLNISNRIEPPMPSAILSQQIVLPAGMDALLKALYGESFKDECVKVLVTQVATGPLTALNAMQLCKIAPQETFVVHLIGAELQFEGDSLNKWETFFLHLVPDITELRVVFIGPELNVENLPVEILSRIR